MPGIEPFFPPERYAQAFVKLAQGDYSAAVAMLQAAVREDPLAAAPAGTGAGLAQAGAALRDGDVAAAVAALDGVKEAAPAWAEPTR